MLATQPTGSPSCPEILLLFFGILFFLLLLFERASLFLFFSSIRFHPNSNSQTASHGMAWHRIASHGMTSCGLLLHHLLIGHIILPWPPFVPLRQGGSGYYC